MFAILARRSIQICINSLTDKNFKKNRLYLQHHKCTLWKSSCGLPTVAINFGNGAAGPNRLKPLILHTFGAVQYCRPRRGPEPEHRRDRHCSCGGPKSSRIYDEDQYFFHACFQVLRPKSALRFRYLAIAKTKMPSATIVAARSLLDLGPSPNHMTPIIDAKITELSLSADTTPKGAIVLAYSTSP